VEAYKDAKNEGTNIFQKAISEMAVKMLALCAGRSLAPVRILVIISARG
jgi:hypothetical protein